jgi:EAL domain-containing protein (putative c-di-GMP-specific phosphodiesterase class I)
MYQAKEQGRNNIQFYTAALSRAAAERLRLERDLRRAIEARQFELHYQPQVRGRDGRVMGFEALLRWRHPIEGLVSPARFIPVAEDSGLILPIGEWVLDEACRQLAEWRRLGHAEPVMAVNLSARQLRSATLLADVTMTLGKHGLAGGDLELEITESVAMKDPEASIGILKSLRIFGVHLSIDDFGTGYSSLNYLKLLPLHQIKLDQSFVRGIESDANNAAICTATITMAHSLGLTVVAEGVESEAERDFLVSRQCDLLQGYLFSRPMGTAEATAFLEAHAARS